MCECSSSQSYNLQRTPAILKIKSTNKITILNIFYSLIQCIIRGTMCREVLWWLSTSVLELKTAYIWMSFMLIIWILQICLLSFLSISTLSLLGKSNANAQSQSRIEFSVLYKIMWTHFVLCPCKWLELLMSITITEQYYSCTVSSPRLRDCEVNPQLDHVKLAFLIIQV